MGGVWDSYARARDAAGWAWSDAERAARDRWGATKGKTKETWDQARCFAGRAACGPKTRRGRAGGWVGGGRLQAVPLASPAALCRRHPRAGPVPPWPAAAGL